MLRLSPRLDEAEAIACCDFPACRGACCVHGVWVDLAEQDAILRHADLIQPYLPPDAQDPRTWFTAEEEADPYVPTGRVRHTRVLPRSEHPLGTACVFWIPPDGLCALQVTAEAQGWHPWTLKPFYCVLHPLDIDDQGRITLDEVGELLDTPGGCLRPGDQPRPLREVFARELHWILGVRAEPRGSVPSPKSG